MHYFTWVDFNTNQLLLYHNLFNVREQLRFSFHRSNRSPVANMYVHIQVVSTSFRAPSGMPRMAMARSARGSIMPLFGQIGPCKNAGPTLYLHRTIVRNWGRSPINISETSKIKHPRKYLILTIFTHEFKILKVALAQYLYAIPHSRTFPKMYCTNVLSTYHLLLKYVA